MPGSTDDDAGPCPECGRPAEWVPIDAGRRGRACRHCAWAELPRPVAEKHTVVTVLHRMFPHSRLAASVGYILMRATGWWHRSEEQRSP